MEPPGNCRPYVAVSLLPLHAFSNCASAGPYGATDLLAFLGPMGKKMPGVGGWGRHPTGCMGCAPQSRCGAAVLSVFRPSLPAGTVQADDRRSRMSPGGKEPTTWSAAATFAKAGASGFLSRPRTISIRSCATRNEMRCGPTWWSEQKTGSGVAGGFENSGPRNTARCCLSGPCRAPANGVAVNEPVNLAELDAIGRSCPRGSPYGSSGWVKKTAKKFGLESSLRRPGRPKKSRNWTRPGFFRASRILSRLGKFADWSVFGGGRARRGAFSSRICASKTFTLDRDRVYCVPQFWACSQSIHIG